MKEPTRNVGLGGRRGVGTWNTGATIPGALPVGVVAHYCYFAPLLLHVAIITVLGAYCCFYSIALRSESTVVYFVIRVEGVNYSIEIVILFNLNNRLMHVTMCARVFFTTYAEG